MVTQQLLVFLEPAIPQDLATRTVSGACYCRHGHCLWIILFILTSHLLILELTTAHSPPLFIALTTAEIVRTLGLHISSWHLELPPGRGGTFPVRDPGRCVHGWPPCILIVPRRYVCICASPPWPPASLSNDGGVGSFLMRLLHSFVLPGLHQVLLSQQRLVAGYFPCGQFSPNLRANAEANDNHCVI